MLKTIEGVFHKGKIELSGSNSFIPENSRIIVTILNDETINLSSCGINKNEAAELRSNLASFACDWDSPEMDIYNTLGFTQK